MKLLNIIGHKAAMIKEIFTQQKSAQVHHFKLIEAEIVSLKERLSTIERTNTNILYDGLSADTDNSSAMEEMDVQQSKRAQSDKEKILKKLDVYYRVINAESNRKSLINNIYFCAFCLWFS